MNDLLPEARGIWQLCGIGEPIILASSSPRRAALLRAVGCPFEVVDPKFQEEEYGLWDAGELLIRRAVQKARSVREEYPANPILAADTVVLLGDRVFGKPRSKNDAVEMLQALSGRTHEVVTALCYMPAGEQTCKTATSRTSVAFRSLTPEEISAYIITGEPLDKAGAYGIQGIGGLWVRKIQGCYFNVVGLPLSQLWDLFTAP